MSYRPVVWTPERCAELRALWGTMTGEKIGEAIFGVSGRKNAVVGQAHRMELPLIAEAGKGRKPVEGGTKRAQSKRAYQRRRREAAKAGIPWPVRSPTSTLPALTPLQSLIALANQLSKGEIAPMPPKKEKVVPRSARIVLGEMHQCAWPIGDPGTPGFKFCCEPAERGKSYCEVHRKIAYVPRPRERVW